LTAQFLAPNVAVDKQPHAVMNMDARPNAARDGGTRPRRVSSYAQEHAPITVTLVEASRISGLGRSKLYQLLADGRLDSVVVDRRRLIQMHSLRRLLNA
jgi:hypothetical protein